MLIVLEIKGWKESGKMGSLLEKHLEDLDDVIVITPEYLDGRGIFVRFRSHFKIGRYAARVKAAYEQIKKEYPGDHILVVGHSLGGLIARLLCKKKVFDPQGEGVILVGTPNMGLSEDMLSKKSTSILKFLALYVFNVPLFFQILPGSNFLRQLNKDGFPQKAIYIYGTRDTVVLRSSADPLGFGIEVDCNHHFFPKDGNGAIPVIREIIEQILA